MTAMLNFITLAQSRAGGGGGGGGGGGVLSFFPTTKHPKKISKR